MKTGVLGVAGFESAQQKLKTYLEGQRVHPSLLLVGPPEPARWEIAKALALRLMAQKKSDSHTESNLWRRIEKGIHPDVYLYQEPEEASIKIEVVRQLCQQMEYAALEGGAKVCVLDDCHRLTDSAANALLKSLEESGPDRYYLLLTHQPGGLLPTILSRCIQFPILPDPQNHGLAPAPPEFEAGLLEFQKTRNTLCVQELIKEKESCLAFLHFLQRHLHHRAIQNLDENIYAYLSAFNACLEAESQLRSNANYGLILENLLIHHFTGEGRP